MTDTVKIRQAILDSAERAARLAEMLQRCHGNVITMRVDELRLLIAEHSFVCGFALGAIDKDRSVE